MANLIQKKIVLLGASGVGKTSLVRRFVQSLFDERYLSTIGVKVDKKLVAIGPQQVLLVLWDIAGPESPFQVPTSYLRGAAGYLCVVDGTRPETLEQGLDMVRRVEREVGPLPCVLALNKLDLVQDWRVQDADLVPFRHQGCPAVHTSAKTGAGVEEAFHRLAARLLPP